jgi:hypothetical protein
MKMNQMQEEKKFRGVWKAVLMIIMTAAMVFTASPLTAHAVTGGKVIVRDHATHSEIIEYRKGLGRIDVGPYAVIRINPEYAKSYYVTYNRGYSDEFMLNQRKFYSRKNTYASVSTWMQTFGSRREAKVNAECYHGFKMTRITNGAESFYVVIGRDDYASASVKHSRERNRFSRSINRADNFQIRGKNGWSAEDVEF